MVARISAVRGIHARFRTSCRCEPDGTLCDGQEALKARAQRAIPDRPKCKTEFQAKVANLDKRQVEADPALRCAARIPAFPVAADDARNSV